MKRNNSIVSELKATLCIEHSIISVADFLKRKLKHLSQGKAISFNDNIERYRIPLGVGLVQCKSKACFNSHWRWDAVLYQYKV